MPKRAIETDRGKVVLRRGPVLFRYRFYTEMSHWDEKKPTRYRAKAGPEVVLRKVSVLFRYKFYAEFFIYSECRIFIWRFYLLTYIGEVVVPVKT